MAITRGGLMQITEKQARKFEEIFNNIWDKLLQVIDIESTNFLQEIIQDIYLESFGSCKLHIRRDSIKSIGLEKTYKAIVPNTIPIFSITLNSYGTDYNLDIEMYENDGDSNQLLKYLYEIETALTNLYTKKGNKSREKRLLEEEFVNLLEEL